MKNSDLHFAVDLIQKHIATQNNDIKGEALSLLTFVKVHNALQAQEIPIKAALIVMFIYLHGHATHGLINDFGIGTATPNKKSCSMHSYFKSTELMNEYIVNENSGCRERGKLFKLTSKGRTLGKRLTSLLNGE